MNRRGASGARKSGFWPCIDETSKRQNRETSKGDRRKGRHGRWREVWRFDVSTFWRLPSTVRFLPDVCFWFFDGCGRARKV